MNKEITVCGEKYKVRYAVFDCISKSVITCYFYNKKDAERWIDEVTKKLACRNEIKQTLQIVKILIPV